MNLKRAYDEFNVLYFGSRLPEINVRWSKAVSKAGCAGMLVYIRRRKRGVEPEIQIATELKRWPRYAHSVLLHECTHLYLDCYVDGRAAHGPRFHACMLNLAKRGAFRLYW